MMRPDESRSRHLEPADLLVSAPANICPGASTNKHVQSACRLHMLYEKCFIEVIVLLYRICRTNLPRVGAGRIRIRLSAVLLGLV